MQLIFVDETDVEVWYHKRTDCSSRGPEFNFQQPGGVLHPPVMGSDALSWSAGVHADRAY